MICRMWFKIHIILTCGFGTESLNKGAPFTSCMLSRGFAEIISGASPHLFTNVDDSLDGFKWSQSGASTPHTHRPSNMIKSLAVPWTVGLSVNLHLQKLLDKYHLSSSALGNCILTLMPQSSACCSGGSPAVFTHKTHLDYYLESSRMKPPVSYRY